MVGNFYALGEGSESDSFLSGSSTGLEACYRSINVCHKPIRESNYVVWKRSILSCLIELNHGSQFRLSSLTFARSVAERVQRSDQRERRRGQRKRSGTETHFLFQRSITSKAGIADRKFCPILYSFIKIRNA